MIITIKTGNAAFADGNRAWEVERILRKLAEDIKFNGVLENWMLTDCNGNTVGSVKTNREDRRS